MQHASPRAGHSPEDRARRDVEKMKVHEALVALRDAALRVEQSQGGVQEEVRRAGSDLNRRFHELCVVARPSLTRLAGSLLKTDRIGARAADSVTTQMLAEEIVLETLTGYYKRPPRETHLHPGAGAGGEPLKRIRLVESVLGFRDEAASKPDDGGGAARTKADGAETRGHRGWSWLAAGVVNRVRDHLAAPERAGSVDPEQQASADDGGDASEPEDDKREAPPDLCTQALLLLSRTRAADLLTPQQRRQIVCGYFNVDAGSLPLQARAIDRLLQGKKVTALIERVERDQALAAVRAAGPQARRDADAAKQKGAEAAALFSDQLRVLALHDLGLRRPEEIARLVPRFAETAARERQWIAATIEWPLRRLGSRFEGEARREVLAHVLEIEEPLTRLAGPDGRLDDREADSLVRASEVLAQARREVIKASPDDVERDVRMLALRDLAGRSVPEIADLFFSSDPLRVRQGYMTAPQQRAVVEREEQARTERGRNETVDAALKKNRENAVSQYMKRAMERLIEIHHDRHGRVARAAHAEAGR